MLWQLLFIMRTLRMFAFGSIGVVLALYLKSIGFSDQRIGVLLMLALLGDSAISLIITRSAERLGMWNMQLAGCLLELASCLVFANPWMTSQWLLVAAATIGVVSPSGKEVGPFMALEQSALAQLLPPDQRTMIYSWYNLLGYLATACGAAQAGVLTDFLQHRWRLSFAGSCRLVFLEAAAVAALQTLAALCWVLRAWQQKKKQHLQSSLHAPAEVPLLTDILEEQFPMAEREELPESAGGAAQACRERQPQQLQPAMSSPAAGSGALSRRTRRLLIQLCLLFAADAAAGSFVTGTLLAYYFSATYGVSPTFLGNMLLGCNVLAGLSTLASGYLATAFGLVRTMVFTHAPSNVFTMLIPLMPTSGLAVAVLLLRSSICQMIVAPRESMFAGIAAPHERTYVLGIANVVRSLACSLGPLVTGHLAAHDRWAWAFYLCGSIKLAHDVAVFLTARAIEIN